jgi:glucans biosynthesis protein C
MGGNVGTQQLQQDLGGRRFDLDWVRIGAFMLLILYHVGMYYVTWDWHVKSPDASHAIEPLMMLTSPWRLSLLFLVSGVATAYLLSRTAKGLLGSRSFRLLVPLLFGMLVIVPPQSYLEVVEKLGYSGSYFDFYRLYITAYHGFCRGSDCLIIPTYNHLWFVAYLWVYTVVLYGLVRLAPGALAGLRRAAERAMSGVGVLLIPLAYLFAARLLLAGRFPGTNALVNDWYNHALYFAMFLGGFTLAATQAPWAALERMRWHSLGVAVLSWASISALASAHTYAPNSHSQAMMVLWQAVYVCEQWLAIAAALGFARRHLNRDSAARRYLTTAIFPVYILHQTVIVVVAHSLKPAHLYPLIEGFLLVCVTASFCFLGYEVIRRLNPLKPLFGLTLERSTAVRRKPVLATLRMAGVPDDIT